MLGDTNFCYQTFAIKLKRSYYCKTFLFGRSRKHCLMKLVFQAHLADECPKLPLPCPNKCDKKLEIPRDEVLVLFSITSLKSPQR